MRFNSIGVLILVSVLICTQLYGCGPSERRKAELAEQRRVECLDKICEGDVVPAVDRLKLQTFKVNGRWFTVPKEYGGYDGTIGFFWPSKVPANKESAEKDAPEFIPSGPNRNSNAYNVEIEIFLRSNNIPPEPRGYKLIELAQQKGWIAERKTLRPGLDAIRMKHVLGPSGHVIDHVTYYVATEQKGFDGLPPVATCNHDNPQNGGGTGFLWKPGIWIGTRWNQKHCADWPEIYQELVHVLSLVKEQ
jgi:hypothetical protein